MKAQLVIYAQWHEDECMGHRWKLNIGSLTIVKNEVYSTEIGAAKGGLRVARKFGLELYKTVIHSDMSDPYFLL